jgi:plastocyanin
MRTSVWSRPLLSRVLTALAALVVAAGVASAETRTVSVGPNGTMSFQDSVSGNSTTTIHVGDGVSWVWATGFHTTTCNSPCPAGAPGGGWDSGAHGTPFTYPSSPLIFPTAGSYPYHCLVHGLIMSGTIVVQPAAGSAPVANFTFAPANPVIQTAVQFTDTSTNTPTSWAWNFGDPASGTSNTSTSHNPTHTFLSAGTYQVALTATNASGSNTITKGVTVSNGGPVPCVPNDQTMCLNGGRYAATAEWTKTDGSSGQGTAVKLTDDSGYFWFFDSANIEVVMKVLDGCSINGSHWVFAAGLTNVEVQLKVVDGQTGIVYEKLNPLNTAFAPIQDTGAFPDSCQ